MSLKLSLVVMTLIAVVSDSLLHPFYPQYFAAVLGVHDAQHVGMYIAACSLTVMLALPVWARIAARVQVLHLLIGTQIVTGLLSLLCFTIQSLPLFWAVSLVMMVFKASYLLIYPYVMSLEQDEHQIGTISLLAFVLYSGNTLAALVAGGLFEWFDPRLLFVAMAVGDLLQLLVCVYLLRLPPLPVEPDAADADAGAEPAQQKLPRGFVYRLGGVMLVLYFSAYVTEPFFSMYWERLSASDNKVLSGFVFAIPGIAALLGLWFNASARETRSPYAGILPAIALATAGLLLQLSTRPLLMLAGRLIYGWAVFQSMVRLDRLLFAVSSKESYSVDFGKINLFQGLGVQIASFAAGGIVTVAGLGVPFVVAAAGFGAGLLLYWVLFRSELRPATTQALPAGALRKGGAAS